jgi:FlaA1/EpsC-like NDP-sugar epimerase
VEWYAQADAVRAGRPELFVQDFAGHEERIRDELSGRTVCVIGAGGSIGRATAEMLLSQRPKRTVLVDISENNLAEITRRLRNCFQSNAPDFEAWALDFTGAPFRALLEREKSEIILNFAAFKHVRSEKDQLTLAEMIRVNVLGNLALVRWAAFSPVHRLFVISTDKAANPVSCMGATKRLMEQVLFSAASASPPLRTILTSTRFANVLFSDGSLPASFVQRFEQRQPLAGPSDVRRYFITPREAARLCLLAACHPSSGEILVPRMRPESMLSFVDIAERFLRARGYAARHYGADTQAAMANLERDAARGVWPCLFTPATTCGEKLSEEFTEAGEMPSAEQLYAEIAAMLPAAPDGSAGLGQTLDRLAADLADPRWLMAHGKPDIVQALADLVPAFRHVETGLNLDQQV